DHDGLPVAARGQCNIRRKSWSAGNDLEVSVGATSLKASGNAAAGFAPRSGKHSAAGDDIARKIEPVAVAGAGQALVETVAAGADGVGGAAADAFARTVIQRDGAAAGPHA